MNDVTFRYIKEVDCWHLDISDSYYSIPWIKTCHEDFLIDHFSKIIGTQIGPWLLVELIARRTDSITITIN